MEELHRLHKDVPFGWFAMLQGAVAAYRRRSATRRTRAGCGPARLDPAR
ncbi:hypothetical protein [Caulobacter mirabilis]|nr:hypothetical protein [Caulobacter mirabilis]